MRIAIRADASPLIGSGHIMRMLTLAHACRGASITFYLHSCPSPLLARIEQISKIVWLEAATITAFIKQCRADVIIIDHYGISAADEARIKAECGAFVIALDDTYAEHQADLVISPNIYTNAAKFSATHQLLGGAPNSLLRDEFFDVMQMQDAPTKRYDLLITLGASALTQRLLQRIEQALWQLPSFSCCVVVGSAMHWPRLKHARHISVVEQTQNMATLMRQSRAIICAGGGTIKEAVALNMPILAISIAQNQHFNMAYAHRNRLAWVRNWRTDTPILRIADDISTFMRYKQRPLKQAILQMGLTFRRADALCTQIKAAL